MTTVPAPGGLDDAQVPVERLDAIGEAAQARAAGVVSAADAVVGDLDDGPGRRGARSAPEPTSPARTWRRWPAPRCHEVRRELDRLGQWAVAVVATRWSAPSSARPASRARPRGRGRARPGGCRAPARAAPRATRPARARARDELLRRRVVADAALEQAQLQRRARRAAAGRRRGGCAPGAGARRRSPRRSARARPAPRRAAPRPPHAGARSRAPCAAAADGLDELGVVVERGVVDEGGELDAVALHLGGRAIGGDRGTSTGRPSASA